MIDHHELVSAMMSYTEQQFIRALRWEPDRRSMQVSYTVFEIFLNVQGQFFSPYLVPSLLARTNFHLELLGL